MAELRSGNGWDLTPATPDYDGDVNAAETRALLIAEPDTRFLTTAQFIELGNTLPNSIIGKNGAGAIATITAGEGISILNDVISTSFQEAVLTWGATVTWDHLNEPRARAVVDQAGTINCSNIVSGQILALSLTQDATGGHAVTFGTGFDDPSKIQVDTAANARTDLLFYTTDQPTVGVTQFDNIGDSLTIRDLAPFGPSELSAANDQMVVDDLSEGNPDQGGKRITVTSFLDQGLDQAATVTSGAVADRMLLVIGGQARSIAVSNVFGQATQKTISNYLSQNVAEPGTAVTVDLANYGDFSGFTAITTATAAKTLTLEADLLEGWSLGVWNRGDGTTAGDVTMAQGTNVVISGPTTVTQDQIAYIDRMPDEGADAVFLIRAS